MTFHVFLCCYMLLIHFFMVLMVLLFVIVVAVLFVVISVAVGVMYLRCLTYNPVPVVALPLRFLTIAGPSLQGVAVPG